MKITSPEWPIEYCTNCNADLFHQRGFDPSRGYWICKGCGQLLTNPDDPRFDSPSGIYWFCDKCNDFLNLQPGFSEACESWTCTKCGFENRMGSDTVFSSDWDWNRAKEDPAYWLSQKDRSKLEQYPVLDMIDDEHRVYLVGELSPSQELTGNLFVRKDLKEYNAEVFRYLQNHPQEGIPQIHELFVSDRFLTVIEDYIEGETLQELLEEQLFSENEAIEIMHRIGRIVAGLHHSEPPIIHRDIKPANIIRRPDGEIFLLDINAAKWYRPDESQDTKLLGTQGFAAPEQYGFSASSPQTDIYALGVLLNVMLTGELPNRQMAEGISGAVVAKCTQMAPEERYRDVEELLEALRSKK